MNLRIKYIILFLIFLVAFMPVVSANSQGANETAKPQLSQEEVKWLNDMEREWAANIDKAVPFIQKKNDRSAMIYLAKSDKVISDMKAFLIKKGYDIAAIDRLVAMENMTGAYTNMAKIAAYSKDNRNAMKNFQKMQALFYGARTKLKIAEDKFHELPFMQKLCRDFIGILDEFEKEVKSTIYPG